MLSYDPAVSADGFSIPVIWFGPRMVCPFVADDEDRVSLPHLDQWVEWTARHAAEGAKPEAQVAQTLWKFLCECDALMAEEWKDKKAYDLQEVRHELKRWLS